MTGIRLTKYRVVVLVCLAFLYLQSPNTYAQKWEASLQIGSNQYKGDLEGNRPISVLKPHIGLSGSYYFNGTWATRALAQFATHEGSNPNSHFSSNTYSISGLIDFHFLEFLHQKSKYIYTPYIFTGLSVYFNDAQMNPSSNTPLPKKQFLVGFPIGTGYKLNLKSKFSVGIEIQYNHLFSDYFDMISYPHSKQNDGFISGQIVFSRLLYRGRCPQWR